MMDQGIMVMIVALIGFATCFLYYACFTLIGKKINYELR
jgi:hypothetical protein